MCYVLRIGLIVLLIGFTIKGIAQTKADTIYSKKDAGNIPPTLPPSYNDGVNKRLQMAPDQIGFGKLSIDTSDIYANRKNGALQNMSIRQYMAAHEKEFKAWEYNTYGISQVNLSLGTLPTTKTSLSILGINIAIRIIQPGINSTKLSPDGLPKQYPVQERQNIEMKRHIEKLQREILEKQKESPFNRLDNILDEIYYFLRTQLAPQLASRLSPSFTFKL